MTPEKKAKKLVEKFNEFLPHSYIQNEYAKQCSLICVNEIISEVKNGRKMDWILERKEGREYVEYWNKVKTEIEKL